MTTSGRSGNPTGRRPGEAGTTPGAVQSPDTAAAGDTPGKGPLAAARQAPPDDPQELEQEIERTRTQLGETVEQLAAKADVKSRAQAKAAQVSGQVKAKVSQAQQEAAGWAGMARSQLADKTATARQKAASAGGTGQGQLRTRVAAVGAPVWEAAPEPVRRAAAKGASGARERRVPLALAAVVLIAAYLAIRSWRKR